MREVYTSCTMHGIGRTSECAKSCRKRGIADYAKKYPYNLENGLKRSDEKVRRLGQTMADGKSCSPGPVLTGRLVEDMSQMVSDRFLAESEFLCDLAVG